MSAIPVSWDAVDPEFFWSALAVFLVMIVISAAGVAAVMKS